MTDLADPLLLSKSAATRLADRLVARGLVERSPCSLDRLGTEVELTDLGKETFVAAAVSTSDLLPNTSAFTPPRAMEP